MIVQIFYQLCDINSLGCDFSSSVWLCSRLTRRTPNDFTFVHTRTDYCRVEKTEFSKPHRLEMIDLCSAQENFVHVTRASRAGESPAFDPSICDRIVSFLQDLHLAEFLAG